MPRNLDWKRVQISCPFGEGTQVWCLFPGLQKVEEEQPGAAAFSHISGDKHRGWAEFKGVIWCLSHFLLSLAAVCQLPNWSRTGDPSPRAQPDGFFVDLGKLRCSRTTWQWVSPVSWLGHSSVSRTPGSKVDFAGSLVEIQKVWGHSVASGPEKNPDFLGKSSCWLLLWTWGED